MTKSLLTKNTIIILTASKWHSMSKVIKHFDLNSNKGLCSTNPCGVNANCHEELGRPICTCITGYTGNPLSHCRRAECLDDSECPNSSSCRDGSCVELCVGACGVNANCKVRIIRVQLNKRFSLHFFVYFLFFFMILLKMNWT